MQDTASCIVETRMPPNSDHLEQYYEALELKPGASVFVNREWPTSMIGNGPPLHACRACAGLALQNHPFPFRLSSVRRKRYDSVPVSMMCARSVIRSKSALHKRALGITWVHSEKGRFVVRISAAFSARSATTWNRSSAPTSARGT